MCHNKVVQVPRVPFLALLVAFSAATFNASELQAQPPAKGNDALTDTMRVLASHSFERAPNDKRSREFYNLALASFPPCKNNTAEVAVDSTRTVILYEAQKSKHSATAPEQAIWALTLPKEIAFSAKNWDVAYHPETERVLIFLFYYDSVITGVYDNSFQNDPKSPRFSIRIWSVDPALKQPILEVLAKASEPIKALQSSSIHFSARFKLPLPDSRKTHLVGIQSVRVILTKEEADVYLIRHDVSDPIQMKVNLKTEKGAIVKEPRGKEQ